MTAFRQWEPDFSEKVIRHLQADRVEFSDLTPAYLGNVFVENDRDKESVAFAEICGCGVYRGILGGRTVFSFPFGGGDKAESLRTLAASCRNALLPLRFYPVGEAELALLKSVLGGEWKATELPETADYVYDAVQLAAPEGIRIVKRTIRKFEALGPWFARDAVREDIPEMLGILEMWTAARGGSGGADHDICRDAVQGLGSAGSLATVIVQNGRMVAFEIGRRLNADMLIAEFEKCDPQVPGGCQVANREFVRRWAESAAFVNRACDLGDPGLALTKSLYRPCRMVRKFVAGKVA